MGNSSRLEKLGRNRLNIKAIKHEIKEMRPRGKDMVTSEGVKIAKESATGAKLLAKYAVDGMRKV